MRFDQCPVLFDTDVVVVGGGPAGMCAAIAASRHGTQTAVIERWPILGGQATMCNVCIWHTSDKTREVVLGLTREFIERLERYGGIARRPRFPHTHETYDFNPEWMTVVYDDFVRELGIRTLCYTPCVGAVTAGRILTAVVVGTKQGVRLVRGKIFVDATGDADLAHFAGCPTVVGRESDGKVQGMTLMSSFQGLDVGRMEEIRAAQPSLMEKMRALRDQGRLPSFGGFGLDEGRRAEWLGTQIACIAGDPLDEESLTRATMTARGKLPAFLRFLRENGPGCRNLDLRWTAPALGVRESRRVQGRYTFSAADVAERRSFPDAIGHGFWMIDIHDPEGTGYTTWLDKSIHLPPGETYQIPYRILTPTAVDNLLVAGRCASATHEGMAALRIQSHCHIMGQAAGTAAAMCLNESVRPVDVDIAHLQRRLMADGVWIDQGRIASNA